ncbi:MAG TPA: MinD/ParA family protein, partial [Phycisphaerales bacterium]|nr:MinD/ParA family protein [Phycisphaerales bacterium]
PEAPAIRARSIAIASGKGGVGKTTLSVNLAAELARTGSRVTLFDGDLGLGNADVLCGVTPTGHLGHVISGQRTLREITIRTHAGFTLVPGASGVEHLADMSETERERLLEDLQPVERDCDALLIDCGAGIGPSVLSFVSAADVAIIVTTPDPTAITDAYALIKCITRRSPDLSRADPVRLMLVVNQAADIAEARHVHGRIDAACRRFLNRALPFAGMITSDEAARNAARERRIFLQSSPSSHAARDVRSLSAYLRAELLINHGLPAREGGLIARLLRFVRP